MNISRLSTLLPSLAIAVITLGLAAVPALADPGDDDGCHEHKEDCGGGGGGGGDVAEYSVTISGAMTGASDHNWRGNFGGKKNIGLNDASPSRMVGEFTNLEFFTNTNGPFGGLGAMCFPKASFPLTIHQAIIKRGKGGRAQAGFWFDGKTDDGTTAVLYALALFGQFNADDTDIPWLPPDETTHKILMMDWKMIVENERKEIRSMSCIGESDPPEDITVWISVTNEPSE